MVKASFFACSIFLASSSSFFLISAARLPITFFKLFMPFSMASRNCSCNTLCCSNCTPFCCKSSPLAAALISSVSVWSTSDQLKKVSGDSTGNMAT